MINCEQWRVSFQNPHLKGHFGWYKPSKLLPWLLVTIKDLKLSLFPLFLLFFFLNYAKKKKHTHTHAHTLLQSFCLIENDITLARSAKDMAKRAGWVGFGSNQSGCGSKWVILNELKMGSGQSGCRSDQVGVTRIFYIKFFFIKKTTCICHLESYITNYLM